MVNHFQEILMGDAGHKWYILFNCKYAYMCLYIFHSKLNIISPYIMSKKIEPNILKEVMVISVWWNIFCIYNFQLFTWLIYSIHNQIKIMNVIWGKGKLRESSGRDSYYEGLPSLHQYRNYFATKWMVPAYNSHFYS